MFKFGIQNLRRLENVPPIEIKALTFLVGRNSSGKSSFLRTFPLLRQSFATRTSGPILWYGDLVDFESFQGSVFNNDARRSLSFSFGLSNVITQTYGYGLGGRYLGNRPRYEHGAVEIEYSISADEEKTKVSRVRFNASKRALHADIELGAGNAVTSLRVNGEERLKEFSGTPILGLGSLLLDFYIKDGEAESDPRVQITPIPIFITSRFARQLYKEFKLDKGTEPEWGRAVANEILFWDEIDEGKILAALEKIKSPLPHPPSQLSKASLSTLSKEANRLSSLYHLFPLLESASESFNSFISGSLYIGPARARSERYYRYQDLAVSEIDPDGKNFPMFINSLPPVQLEAFSSWIESLYGYRLFLKRSPGHISIEIGDGKARTNIVDTGYGVSQILPVLGQIWWASNGTSQRQIHRKRASVVAIEQPELHLHPAHQALLADAFVSATSEANQDKKNSPLHFIVETHSEALINRAGELVGNGKIAASDVQILIFEPAEGERSTNVRMANFGQDGQLIHWPYGFFQPS